jgi:hypothetical protein
VTLTKRGPGILVEVALCLGCRTFGRSESILSRAAELQGKTRCKCGHKEVMVSEERFYGTKGG